MSEIYILQREYLGDGLRTLGYSPDLDTLKFLSEIDAEQTLMWHPGDWLVSDCVHDTLYHIHKLALLDRNSILPGDSDVEEFPVADMTGYQRICNIHNVWRSDAEVEQGVKCPYCEAGYTSNVIPLKEAMTIIKDVEEE